MRLDPALQALTAQRRSAAIAKRFDREFSVAAQTADRLAEICIRRHGRSCAKCRGYAVPLKALDGPAQCRRLQLADFCSKLGARPSLVVVA
ncbi:MAG TPA: hypothetical protein VIH71_17370 [Solirubrobacteraceae bacterium]